MTGRSGAFSLPPSNDKVLFFHSSYPQVEYTIKSAKDDSIYTVTVPWILVQIDKCLDPYNAWVLSGGLTVATPKPSEAPQAGQAGRITKKPKFSVKDLTPSQRQAIKLADQTMFSVKDLTPSQRQAIKLADQTMSVQRYDSFEEDLGEKKSRFKHDCS